MKDDERLKNILISDKHFNPEYLVKVLRSDMLDLLLNYMNILPQNIDISIFVDEKGVYNLKISAKTDRLKIFGANIM